MIFPKKEKYHKHNRKRKENKKVERENSVYTKRGIDSHICIYRGIDKDGIG